MAKYERRIKNEPMVWKGMRLGRSGHKLNLEEIDMNIVKELIKIAQEVALTDSQGFVLNALKSGDEAVFMRYMGRFNPKPYWYLRKSGKKVTKEIEFLSKNGMVRIINKGDEKIAKYENL